MVKKGMTMKSTYDARFTTERLQLTSMYARLALNLGQMRLPWNKTFV